MKTSVKSFFRKFVPLLLATILVAACAAPMFAEGGTDNPFVYSDLNKTPGGTYGYLTTSTSSSDELAFLLESSGIPKYTDIRFFGVDFSLSNGVPSLEQSTVMAEELLKKGVNFVRITDVYAGLTVGGGELNDAALSAFDSFIFQLYLKGIYVELDLFTPASLGTSSVGAFIDSKIVDKALRFVKRFFSHVGPNDRTYALESTIVMVKYIDNTSVSYLKDGEVNTSADILRTGFNSWLSSKYETNDKLIAAWRAADSTSALAEGESLGNVNIGNFGLNSDLLFDPAAPTSARQADFVAYLTDAATASYQRVVSTLRELEYSSLILCSDASTGPFSTRVSGIGDAAAKTIFYDGSNIQTAMKNAASGVISGKPFVLNWDTSVQTAEKSKAFTELVIYACMQGYDAMTVGEYKINNTDGSYSVSNDAELWQQFGLFATIFRHRSITPSRTQVEYVYTTNDTVAETGNFGNTLGFAALMSKAGITFIDELYTGTANLAISSGNCSFGDYSTAVNNVIVQSYTDMQTPAKKSFDKTEWLNANVEKKAMEQVDINGIEFRIGNERAIAVDGTVENIDTLTQVMHNLGTIDASYGYVDGVINSDNGQIAYNTNTGVITASAGRLAAFTGPVGSDGAVSGNVTYKANGVNASVIVYPMDSSSLDSSSDLLIYARGASASDMLQGTLTFKRENCTFEFYGINDDGTRSEILAQTKMITTSEGVQRAEVTSETTVELSGGYQNYELVFKEKSVDDILVGYTPKFPERPNLLLWISVPAILFLGVAYAGILLSDKLKIKREEKLRLASMETKMKTRIAHDEHIKKFEAEMEEERIEKERKAQEKEFGYNPLLDETIPEDVRRELAEEMKREQEGK